MSQGAETAKNTQQWTPMFYKVEPAETYDVTVEKVLDGDTVVARFGDGSIRRIRWAYSDAPETAKFDAPQEKGAVWARQAMEERLLGKKVRFTTQNQTAGSVSDAHGRLLGTIDLGAEGNTAQFIRDEKYTQDKDVWGTVGYYVGATGAQINRNLGGIMKMLSGGDAESQLYKMGDEAVRDAEYFHRYNTSPQEPIEGNSSQKIKGIMAQMLTRPDILAGKVLESTPLMGSAAIGTMAAGPVGGIALSTLSMSGNNYQDLRDAGASHDNAVLWGNASALGQAVVEQVSINRLGRIIKGGKTLVASKLPKSAQGPILSVLAGALEDGAVGTAEEATQQLIGNVSYKLAGAKDAPGVFDGMLEAATEGGILEAVMGRGAYGIHRLRGGKPDYDTKPQRNPEDAANDMVNKAIETAEKKNVLRAINITMAAAEKANLSEEELRQTQETLAEALVKYWGGEFVPVAQEAEAPAAQPSEAPAMPQEGQTESTGTIEQEAPQVQPQAAVAPETPATAAVAEEIKPQATVGPQAKSDAKVAQEIGPTTGERHEGLWNHLSVQGGEVFASGQSLNKMPDEAIDKLYNSLGLTRWSKFPIVTEVNGKKSTQKAFRDLKLAEILQETEKRQEARETSRRKFFMPKDTPANNVAGEEEVYEPDFTMSVAPGEASNQNLEAEDSDADILSKQERTEGIAELEEAAGDMGDVVEEGDADLEGGWVTEDDSRGELTGWEAGFESDEKAPQKGKFNPRRAKSKFEDVDPEDRAKINYVIRNVLKVESTPSSIDKSLEVPGTLARRLQETAYIDDQGRVVIEEFDDKGTRAFPVKKILPLVRVPDSKAPGGARYERRALTPQQIRAMSNDLLAETAKSMEIEFDQNTYRATLVQKIIRAQGKLTHTGAHTIDTDGQDSASSRGQSPEMELLSQLERQERKDEFGEKASRWKTIVEAAARGDTQSVLARMSDSEKYNLRDEIDEYLVKPKMADERARQRLFGGVSVREKSRMRALARAFGRYGLTGEKAQWAANTVRRIVENLGGNIMSRNFGMERWMKNQWAQDMGIDFSPRGVMDRAAKWVFSQESHTIWSTWAKDYGLDDSVFETDQSGRSQFSRALQKHFEEKGISWLTEAQKNSLKAKPQKLSDKNLEERRKYRIELARDLAATLPQKVILSGKEFQAQKKAKNEGFLTGFHQNAKKFTEKVFFQMFPTSKSWLTRMREIDPVGSRRFDKDSGESISRPLLEDFEDSGLSEIGLRWADRSGNRRPAGSQDNREASGRFTIPPAVTAVIDTESMTPKEFAAFKKRFTEILMGKLEAARKSSATIKVGEDGNIFRVPFGAKSSEGKVIDIEGLPTMPGQVPYKGARINQKLQQTANAIATQAAMEAAGATKAEIDAFAAENMPTNQDYRLDAKEETPAGMDRVVESAPATHEEAVAQEEQKMTEAGFSKDDFLAVARKVFNRVNSKAQPASAPDSAAQKPQEPAKANQPSTMPDPDEFNPTMDGGGELNDRFWREMDLAALENRKLNRDLQQQFKNALGLEKLDLLDRTPVFEGFTAADLSIAMMVAIDIKQFPKYTENTGDLNARQREIVKLAERINDSHRGTLLELKKMTAIHNARSRELGIEGLKHGVFKDAVNYHITHIWNLGEFSGKKGLFKKKPTQGFHRTFENGIVQGWSLGYNLRVDDFFRASLIAHQNVTEAVLNRKMLELGVKEGYFAVEGNVPKGYVKVGVEGMVVGELTQDGMIFRDLYAPPKIAKYWRNTFGKSALEGNEAIDKLTKINAQMKRIMLLGSGFHFGAFLWSALATNSGLKAKNPFWMYKQGKLAIEALEKPLRDMVGEGLTLGVQMDWDPTLTEGESPWQKQSKSASFLDKRTEKIRSAVESFEKALFQKFGASLKAQTALMRRAYMLKKHAADIASGKITEQQINRAVAEEVNNDFGGVHYRRKGWNPTGTHMARLGLLGPDWTISNVRTLTSLVSEDALVREVHWAMWKNVFINCGALWLAGNLLMSGFDDDDFAERVMKAWKTNPLSVLDIDITPLARAFGRDSGERTYLSAFRHFKDPVKWIWHPIKSARGKSAMWLKPVIDGVVGSDFAKRPFTSFGELMETGQTTSWDSKNEGPFINPDQAVSFALRQTASALPIPVQALMEYFLGQIDGLEAIAVTLGTEMSQDYGKSKKYSK